MNGMWANNDTEEFKSVVTRAEELAAGVRVGPQHLFLAVLETSFGESLLESLRIDRETVSSCSPSDHEHYEDCLKQARRLTVLTDPGIECIEQVVHGLLIDRESSFAQALDRFGVDRPELAEELVREMRAGGPLSMYSMRDVSELARSEGRALDFAEGDLVRVCLRQESLAREVLCSGGVDVEALSAQAAGWVNSCSPSNRVPVGRAGVEHLALSLVGQPSVQSLMTSVGIVPERLRLAVQTLIKDYPYACRSTSEELSAVSVARQEAMRLGCAEVTPDLLLLGLLADTESGACRALQQCGIEPTSLREEITLSLRAEKRSGDPRLGNALQRVLSEAEALSPELGPKPIHLLYCLLPECSVLQRHLSALRPTVRIQVEGLLDKSLEVSCGGLRVGMTPEAVRETRRDERPVENTADDGSVLWTFSDVTASFVEGRVVVLYGDAIEENGEKLLDIDASPERVQLLLGANFMKFFSGPPALWVGATLLDGVRVQGFYVGDSEYTESLRE